MPTLIDVPMKADLNYGRCQRLRHDAHNQFALRPPDAYDLMESYNPPPRNIDPPDRIPHRTFGGSINADRRLSGNVRHYSVWDCGLTLVN